MIDHSKEQLLRACHFDGDYTFRDISGAKGFETYGQDAARFLKRSLDELEYFCFRQPLTSTFCILREDAIVGFQCFLYKPIVKNEITVPAFRSEFTIAEKDLRSTGLFPKFYKWCMDEVVRKNGKVYFWGSTRHRGWLKYGFTMHKRMTFYQVYYGRHETSTGRKMFFNRALLQTFGYAWSFLGAWRHLIPKKRVTVAGAIGFDQFMAYYGRSKRFAKPYFDSSMFSWRLIENYWDQHEFLMGEDGLLIGLSLSLSQTSDEQPSA